MKSFIKCLVNFATIIQQYNTLYETCKRKYKVFQDFFNEKFYKVVSKPRHNHRQYNTL
jgi:hypothetical protein